METPTKIDQNGSVACVNELDYFRAIYSLVKGKRDTDIKLFRKYKRFTYSDIVELNDRINIKLQNHELITNIVHVIVGLRNKEIKSFGSWGEFKNADWHISARTRYVTLEWDFNLILPNQQHSVPQTHTLRVRMGNSLRPNEVLNVVFLGDDECELEEVQSQMVCKIDFVNTQICTELKQIVSDWYDALADVDQDNIGIAKWVGEHSKFISRIILVLVLGVGMFVLDGLFFVHQLHLDEQIGVLPFYAFLYVIGVSCLFWFMGGYFATYIVKRYIAKIRRIPMFDLTRGDKNCFDTIKKDNGKLVKKVGESIFAGIVVNVILWICKFCYNLI